MGKHEKVIGNYRRIYWDWDGCLAMSLHVWVKHYTKTFAAEGIEKTREEIVASMGHFRRDIQSWGHSLAEANRLVKLTHDRATPELKKVTLYPNAIETVRHLNELGITQAIVTKSPRRIIEAAVEYHDIARYFGAIVCGDDVLEQYQKPHRYPVDKAAELLGKAGEHAVLIGDSHTDLLTAKNAGVNSVLYYPNENKEFYRLKKLKKYKPTHTIHDLAEVVKLVA